MGVFRSLIARLRGSSGQTESAVLELADFIPPVTREDVQRIIRREFPSKDGDAILAILDQYGSESWHPERDRVHIAILKISDGKPEQLLSAVELACSDFRDAISAAEYPEYSKLGFVGVDRMALEDVRRLQARDAKQYYDWLMRKLPETGREL
jgi:hypothetical protein